MNKRKSNKYYFSTFGEAKKTNRNLNLMNITLTEAEKIKILNSDDLYRVMQQILLREDKIDQDREHFWVVGLATNNRILFIELISKGTIDQTIVEPMEVFSLALQKRATKIILVHNHPSRELKPSEGDKDTTDRLIQVGIIVDTFVIDHLIISDRSYLSFADIGLLDELKQSLKYVPPYVVVQRIKKEAAQIAEQKSRKQIAKKLKEQGMPPASISEATGLTVEEIEKIKVRK